ncbi:hypothetical protein HYPSUDRAFT_220780 [Hypholoma sublateritium FD-334 SS-4]|uniref:Cyclase family protein n=1 Tax=Hypholoma sublateritium (strain FD-334 SS-4) TaxID=945553 RepID=A0A0D2NAX7_HYPSF|nr:hypothetical protein HYPSUDRAFT_220780 [Hypholoma sublateritium FD-334 SS-4]
MSSSSRFVDLSHPLNANTQIYPGDPPFTMTPHATHERDAYCVHRLALGTHTGTHIDAPLHFVSGGRAVSAIPLAACVGTPLVVDLSADGLQPREPIAWARLASHVDGALLGGDGARIVLINTGWAAAYYGTPAYLAHPYLLPEVAETLFARGVALVGTDTLSPDETPAEGAEGAHAFGFHERFLGAGGVIAENLTNLEALIAAQRAGGRWIVNLVPLRLDGADGSPVRAFAHSL